MPFFACANNNSYQFLILRKHWTEVKMPTEMPDTSEESSSFAINQH